MSHLSIIGTGNMGQAIAAVAGRGGHTVQLLGENDVETAVSGDIVVLAVPYPAVASVLEQRGAQLEGKIVVDITNPLNFETFDELTVPSDSSAAAEIAAQLPGSKVVKAFNTTFAGTLVEGAVAGQPLDIFLAGDDEAAKDTVKQLVRDGGLRAVDAGPLALAHHLEALGYLHRAIQGDLGTNYASSVKVLA
ncbi:MAG TPA: NADPH-dependent F420 reductase [Nocardioides sp.]